MYTAKPHKNKTIARRKFRIHLAPQRHLLRTRKIRYYMKKNKKSSKDKEKRKWLPRDGRHLAEHEVKPASRRGLTNARVPSHCSWITKSESGCSAASGK